MKAWAKIMTLTRSGFTVIELLIVVAVIGVLAAILFIGYSAVQNNAHDVAIKDDLTKFADIVRLKALDDDLIPDGGATSALTGDSTIFPGITIFPNGDSYDSTVANVYYCAGTIAGSKAFAFIARSVSRKVFYYLSTTGVGEYSSPLTWGTTPTLDACQALGFTDPFTWSYGYDPNSELLWSPWTREIEEDAPATEIDPPIAWWKLNGNASDSIGSANGNVIGAISTVGQNNAPSGAYSFDGVDDYIDLGMVSAVGNLTNNLTISAWISTTTFGIVFAPARTNSANGFKIQSHLFTTYGVKDYTTTPVLATTNGAWHFFVAVLNANNVTYYVDGVETATVTHTTGGVANTDDKLFIGATTATGSATVSSFFSGKIDDVRVYNRVLTGSEITSLYNAGAQ